jgi:hypothetical protein
MKNKRFFILMLSLLIASTAFAKNYILLQDAFAEGGGKSNSSSYILFDLTGQSFVGPSSGVNYLEYGGMLFYSTIYSGVVLDFDDEEIPLTYSLSQNYPNPMRNLTTIKFGIPEVSKVELMIYDVSGRVVKELVYGIRQPGIYTLKWDGSDEYGKLLPSGIYFYRLKTEKFERSLKLILIR